jgi:hypothetical protein
MTEVFISYSQKDRALVAPIAKCLAELGVDAWYDREISAGERFGAVIRTKLKEAKAVLACWSPEAIESEWVEAEADYARELGTYVPIFVAPCALMPPFNRIHTDDLSKWTGEANDPVWIKLIDRLAKLIGREGVAAAARALPSSDEQAATTSRGATRTSRQRGRFGVRPRRAIGSTLRGGWRMRNAQRRLG